MAQSIEDRIKEAQSSPLYKTIYDVIGDTDNIEDAQKLLNKFGRDNSIDPSQLKAFLTENQDTFFSENGRIPFVQNMDNIKFGMNNGNGNTTSSTLKVETSSPNTNRSSSSQSAKAATQEVVEEVAEQTTREGIEELGESNLKKIFNKRS